MSYIKIVLDCQHGLESNKLCKIIIRLTCLDIHWIRTRFPSSSEVTGLGSVWETTSLTQSAEKGFYLYAVFAWHRFYGCRTLFGYRRFHIWISNLKTAFYDIVEACLIALLFFSTVWEMEDIMKNFITEAFNIEFNIKLNVSLASATWKSFHFNPFKLDHEKFSNLSFFSHSSKIFCARIWFLNFLENSYQTTNYFAVIVDWEPVSFQDFI